MRWSQILIPTRKQAPANARSKAEALLLKAGYIQADSRGDWTFLPLGTRTLRKLQQSFFQTLEGLHSVEISSHLEVPELAAAVIRQTQSYRDVPRAIHRLRCSERNQHSIDIIMYSIGADGSEHQRRFAEALANLLKQICSRPFSVGEAGNELAWVSESTDGGTTLLRSDKGNYASLEALAETIVPEWTFSVAPHAELEMVHTPGAASAGDSASVLGLRPIDGLKTLVYQTITSGPALNSGVNPNWVVAVVRGDHQVNTSALQRIARENFDVGLRPLSDSLTLREKFVVGFVGPDAAMRYWDTVLVVDPAAAQDRSWFVGANVADHHVRNFNWFRECGDKLADPKKTVVAPIRVVRPGDASPRNDGGTLVPFRGRLLLQYEPIASTPQSVMGKSGNAEMTSSSALRVDLHEAINSAAEIFADDKGLRWPATLAPFQVVITPIKYDGAVKDASDALHDQLEAVGVSALLDDRDARAGSKFADADLIGIPIRVTIGERTLGNGQIEVKLRHQTDSFTIPLDAAAGIIRTSLEADVRT